MYFIPEGGAFVMQEKDGSRSLLGGVLILGAGNLAVKMIGLFFKIPLSRLLGDLGMGYFNTGYTVYSWLFLVGCTGFPVAVSMLVSESLASDDEGRRGARRILFVSLLFLFVIGSAGCSLLLLFADKIALRIGNPGSAAAVSSIAPAVLFCTLSGGVRGYFQGRKRMGPTAVSQLIEAGLKLVLGILFARSALKLGYDLPNVAAAAIRGVTVGCAASCLFLFIELISERGREPIKYKGRKRSENRSISHRLLRLAAPVTFSATVMSVTGLIDLLFVMKRLVASGMTVDLATALFGNYTTLAVPFFNLPGILISPIATGIVPYLTGDLARGDLQGAEKRCLAAIRSAAVVSVPAALALGMFGERILSLFFLADSAARAASSLAVLSPGIVFLALLTVASAILQARGRAWITVLSMLIGSLVKTVAGYYLIGVSGVGIYGAAIGTVLCYAVAAIIELVWLSALTKKRLGVGEVFRPVLPAILSFSLGYLPTSLIPDRTSAFATLFLLFVSGILYLPLGFLFGCLKREDLKSIPFLHKLCSGRRLRKNE